MIKWKLRFREKIKSYFENKVRKNLPKIEIAIQQTKIEQHRTSGVWSNLAARFSSFNFFKSLMCPLISSDSSVRNFSPYLDDNMRFVLSKAERHSFSSFCVFSLKNWMLVGIRWNWRILKTVKRQKKINLNITKHTYRIH